MGKYKIDESDPSTYVVSHLNNKKYTRITHKHTKKYGLTLDEYMTKYGLSEVDLISKCVHSSLGFTREKAILLYGEDVGVKKWNEYCKKQAVTNTFQYKKDKYGMTEAEFKEYNISRSVTKDNLVKRHGEEIGLQKWDSYCKRQAYAGCSIDYFKEKYGIDRGEKIYNDLCKRKAQTLENFILKYGLEEGTKRYNSRMEDIKPFHSQISQELFQLLELSMINSDGIYYAINDNGEYGIYDDIKNRYYFFDYVDIHKKKCIEFHGDIFHGNPALYTENDTPNVFNRNITCKDMWEYDKSKMDCIKRLRGIDTLVIWESDYRRDKKEQYEKCVEFLRK